MKLIYRFTFVVIMVLSVHLLADDYIFFDDSPTADFYDSSWGFANAPSYLELVVDKFPVEDSIAYSGSNCLKLHWRSEIGGDWAIAVAEDGWPGHDVNLVDTLQFYCYTEFELTNDKLPFIYLEDLSNQKTEKLSIRNYVSNLDAETWTSIQIPLSLFKENSGNADLTRIKTIFFGQDTSDGIEHTLYLDEIKMTGGVAMDSLLEGLTNEEHVLNYLKSIQDYFSDDGFLVPAQEDVSGQTFNNAITAMAFILEGERERAERILDFYAGRTDQDNTELNRQNFYHNGQAKGFYQNIRLVNEGADNPVYSAYLCDRWMGDMAWLVIALKYYEKEYGIESKPAYAELIILLKELLLDFYYDDPGGNGGFVRHGWRWGPLNLRQKDSLTEAERAQLHNDAYLHETDSSGNYFGHEEGNIDCYAVFKLCGEDEIAGKIKQWLDYRMSELESTQNVSLPLDLYSWRSMAFRNEGDYYKELVTIPENDPRFRKEIDFNGKPVVGFYSCANANVENIWCDGLGHMACAFYSSGYSELGDFYSAQFDSLLIIRCIGGDVSLALPYAANKSGDYGWVNIKLGFSSTCAWYLFTKKGFNPFTLECYNQTGLEGAPSSNIISDFRLYQNYPNPFNCGTNIKFQVSESSTVKLDIFDLSGKKVCNLFETKFSRGTYCYYWDGYDRTGIPVSSGIYFYRIQVNNSTSMKKMILLH